MPQSRRSQILHGMDDEGGEPIYIQAQGLRSGRLPQKISDHYKRFVLLNSCVLEMCLIYKVGLAFFAISKKGVTRQQRIIGAIACFVSGYAYFVSLHKLTRPTTWLAKRLNDFDLAYLHVMRNDFFQHFPILHSAGGSILLSGC